MISSVLKRLFTSFLFFSTISYADYGWIPRYQTLWVKAGVDYLSSKENFGSDSQHGDYSFQNRPSEFTEAKFWLNGEYGLANRWSAFLTANFNRSAVDPQTGTATTTPNSSGLQDIYLGTKWNLIASPLLFTLDLTVKIPTYSTSDLTINDLAKGDGDFATSLLGHFGYRASKHFVMDLSPGFMVRSNGYASSLLLQGMFEGLLNPMFLRLSFDYRYGLGKSDPATILLNNNELGSGGTFARISKESDLFTVGVRTGLRFLKSYRMDFSFNQTLGGNRAPHYWQIGMNFYASWDFFKAEKKIKVMEVPFESEQSAEPEKED